MIDFTLPLRTIDNEPAVKLGEHDDPRFKHVVGVGDTRFFVDDEGDTDDMVGFFINVDVGAQAEISIANKRIRLAEGVPVMHVKRGRGKIVAMRGKYTTGGGFGILLDDNPSQSDDDLLWSLNKNIRVLDGVGTTEDDGTLEITLPEASWLRVNHDQRGPGTLVKIRSGETRKAHLGIRLDAGGVKGNGGILWAAFRNVEILNH